MGSGGTLGALRSVWTNEAVRRAQLALAGSTIGNWSYSVAFSVLVYDRAGATWVGLAQVFRLVPAALAAPFLASLVDRYPRQRVLFVTDAVRALTMGGVCLCAALTGPLFILIGLATVTTLVGTLFWPAQGAMLPTLVRDPEELAACNVTQSTIESTGSVIGPGLGGAALAVFGTTLAFLVPVVAYTLSAIAVTRVHPREAAADAAPESGDAGQATSRTMAPSPASWRSSATAIFGCWCPSTARRCSCVAHSTSSRWWQRWSCWTPATAAWAPSSLPWASAGSWERSRRSCCRSACA